MNNDIKVAYLHHQDYHPYHGNYAKGVGADFINLNKYMNRLSFLRVQKIKTLFNYLLLAWDVLFNSYNVIITDGPNSFVCLLKRLSNKKISLVSTQGNEHLVWFFDNKFTPKAANKFKKSINQYDLLVCTGSVQFKLAKKICEGNQNIKIIESFNGVSEDREPKLSKIKYNSTSNKIISVSNLNSLHFLSVKGIDIMLKLFAGLAKKYPDLEYYHLGLIAEETVANLKAENPKYPWHRIHYVGSQKDLEPWFSDALLMLHLSRLDAFPFALTESFCAGLPTFISTSVGTKLMYNNISTKENYIIDQNIIDDGLKKVSIFLEKNKIEKQDISNEFKAISKDFTARKAINNYRNLVHNYC